MSVWSGYIRVACILFADDVVLFGTDNVIVIETLAAALVLETRLLCYKTRLRIQYSFFLPTKLWS